ncbi:MAG TPA: hypothetical protein VIS56_01015 [Candidatus Saccharimonadales bacterium]
MFEVGERRWLLGGQSGAPVVGRAPVGPVEPVKRLAQVTSGADWVAGAAVGGLGVDRRDP